MTNLIDEATLEIAVRRSRMAAATPAERTADATIAALAAGAGAEMVARSQFARDALATRLRRRGDPRSLRIASSLEADLDEGGE